MVLPHVDFVMETFRIMMYFPFLFLIAVAAPKFIPLYVSNSLALIVVCFRRKLSGLVCASLLFGKYVVGE